MWVIDDFLDKCLIARKHVWKKDRAINPKDRPLIRPQQTFGCEGPEPRKEGENIA